MAGNELSNEILAVSFGYGFGLGVENIGQIVVVLLLCGPDFDVWDNVDTRGEVHLGVFVDAADGGHVLAIFHGELLEKHGERVKAMLNVVLVGIAA